MGTRLCTSLKITACWEYLLLLVACRLCSADLCLVLSLQRCMEHLQHPSVLHSQQLSLTSMLSTNFVLGLGDT